MQIYSAWICSRTHNWLSALTLFDALMHRCDLNMMFDTTLWCISRNNNLIKSNLRQPLTKYQLAKTRIGAKKIHQERVIWKRNRRPESTTLTHIKWLKVRTKCEVTLAHCTKRVGDHYLRLLQWDSLDLKRRLNRPLSASQVTKASLIQPIKLLLSKSRVQRK